MSDKLEKAPGRSVGRHDSTLRPRGRRFDLDALKALGCLLVVAYHFHALQTASRLSWAFGQYVDSALAVCVPLFFLVNGCLWARKDRVKLGDHLRGLGVIVLIATIWALIDSFLFHASRQDGATWSVLADALLLKQGVSNTLWFFQAFFVVQLWVPLVLFVRRKSEPAFAALVLGVCVVAFGLDALGRVLAVLSGAGVSMAHAAASYVNGYNPLRYGYDLAYFLVGMLLWEGVPKALEQGAPRLARLADRPLPLVVLALAGPLVITVEQVALARLGAKVPYATYDGFGCVGTFVTVVALYLLLRGRTAPVWVVRVCTLVGANSMSVYLLHVPLLALFWGRLHVAEGLPWVAQIVANMAVCVVLVLGCALAGSWLRRIPVLGHLFRL